MRRGVALMVQVRRGYPLVLARHLKCPIDSRYTDSADSAIQAPGPLWR